jgi:hypothetical protein
VHTFFLRGPAWGAVLAPVVTAMHRAMTGLPHPRVRLAADRRPLHAAARVAERLAASVAPGAHARSVEEAGDRVIRARRGSAAA